MDKADTNLLEVNHLSKIINGKKCLDDVSFTLHAGEILGYLGPNGAGKTTTIRLILGLLNPTKGHIVVNSNSMGVLMDFDCLYKDLTAWDNLMYYDMIYNSKTNRKQRIIYWLKQVGLLEEKNNKIKVFSKGMNKRLALACILIQNPKIIILDEPFLGLDIEWKQKFCEIIKNYNENAGIIVASHDVNEMRKICTKYVMINSKMIFSMNKEISTTFELEQIYLKGLNKE